MPCYSPLKGYRGKIPGPSGKPPIVFNANDGYVDLPVEVSCGQCVGCRLERSRQWAVRCVHEASQHDENAFITLTYSPEHLPPGGSLVPRDFTLFIKRLRKKIGTKIRYFHCGEYGDKENRPHYHALIFGYDFPDKKHWRTTRDDHHLYMSKILDDTWGKGISVIGEVSFESAAYTARYIMKKKTGPMADEHYKRVDLNTGEIFQLQPEYVTMSRRPGIGKDWYDKYSSDAYPSDFVVLEGKKHRPPRFYDQQLEEFDTEIHTQIKRGRKAAARLHAENNTPERMRVREKIQLHKLDQLKRDDLA